MSRALFLLGSAIFLWLWCSHAILTLRDLSYPRYFTPTDSTVCDAMAKAPLALAPQTTVWQSWLGFNLSHSLGLLVFGGLIAALVWRDVTWLEARPVLRLMPALIALVYTGLAIRFWYWSPALATAIGCVCFLAAVFVR